MQHDHNLELPQLERIKQHIKKHKTTYLVGAGCLVTGYCLRSPVVIAPVMNNIVNNNIANNVGRCCKIVQGLDDAGKLKLWPKAAILAEEIAAEHNISFDAARTMLSRHLNGHSEHVFNKQYTTYGLGTTG